MKNPLLQNKHYSTYENPVLLGLPDRSVSATTVKKQKDDEFKDDEFDVQTFLKKFYAGEDSAVLWQVVNYLTLEEFLQFGYLFWYRFSGNEAQSGDKAVFYRSSMSEAKNYINKDVLDVWRKSWHNRNGAQQRVFANIVRYLERKLDPVPDGKVPHCYRLFDKNENINHYVGNLTNLAKLAMQAYKFGDRNNTPPLEDITVVNTVLSTFINQDAQDKMLQAIKNFNSHVYRRDVKLYWLFCAIVFAGVVYSLIQYAKSDCKSTPSNYGDDHCEEGIVLCVKMLVVEAVLYVPFTYVLTQYNKTAKKYLISAIEELSSTKNVLHDCQVYFFETNERGGHNKNLKSEEDKTEINYADTVNDSHVIDIRNP